MEYDDLEAKATKEGITISDYLRHLLSGDLPESRLTSLERRVTHLEEQFALVYIQEGRHGREVS
jgi:hypothetical protein